MRWILRPSLLTAGLGLALGMASLFSLPAAAQVYRCGNSYSHQPCAGGRSVDTSPPLSVQRGQGSRVVLYLCRSYGGGQFWTREHCAQREALVERMESVPAHLDFEQQVEMARSQRDRGQAAAAPLLPAEPPAVSTSRGGPAECAWLEQRIRQLDRMARAGGTAQSMDRIAHERKTARDRQFRIRC